MMAGKDQVLATSDAASIDLLRRLRSGEDIPFVHRKDVCSAAPSELVANLQPVPGTDIAENGYNSVWYFFCPKKYKNSKGKAAGHRQRAIGDGDTCWHAEVSAKDVKGSGGGTFCNLSYGRKKAGSARSLERMGWCLVEYDEDKITSNNAGGDHVLCKVYRSSSSLAKKGGKSGKTPSTSSSSIGSSTSSKRKAAAAAAAEDHPEAGDERPTKLVHHTQPLDDTPFITTHDCYRSIYDEPAVDLASEQGTPFSNNYYQYQYQHPMPPPCYEPDLQVYGVQQPHIEEQVPFYQQQPQYQYGDLLAYQNQAQQQYVQGLIQELGDSLAQEFPDFFDEQGTSCSAQPGSQMTTGAGQQVFGQLHFF